MENIVVDPLKKAWGQMSEAQPIELKKEKTALLVVDMQYYDAHKDYGLVKEARENGVDTSYYEQRLELITSNIQKLLASCRNHNMEVIYAKIESLKMDGRDRSLCHKYGKCHVLPNSKEGEILEEIKPENDEIVLSKTSSGVFSGTNIDQILRNLGIENLIVVGVCTTKCVDTAVRNAADIGYEVVLVEDATADFHPSLQQSSLEILGSCYCRIHTTEEVLNNISRNN